MSISNRTQNFIQMCKANKIIELKTDTYNLNNEMAQLFTDSFYSQRELRLTLHGVNSLDRAMITRLETEEMLIPPNCRFIKDNVTNLANYINIAETFYDLIVIDPPWWNKYIRRAKSANSASR